MFLLQAVDFQHHIFIVGFVLAIRVVRGIGANLVARGCCISDFRVMTRGVASDLIHQRSSYSPNLIKPGNPNTLITLTLKI